MTNSSALPSGFGGLLKMAVCHPVNVQNVSRACLGTDSLRSYYAAAQQPPRELVSLSLYIRDSMIRFDPTYHAIRFVGNLLSLVDVLREVMQAPRQGAYTLIVGSEVGRNDRPTMERILTHECWTRPVSPVGPNDEFAPGLLEVRAIFKIIW